MSYYHFPYLQKGTLPTYADCYIPINLTEMFPLRNLQKGAPPSYICITTSKDYDDEHWTSYIMNMTTDEGAPALKFCTQYCTICEKCKKKKDPKEMIKCTHTHKCKKKKKK